MSMLDETALHVCVIERDVEASTFVSNFSWLQVFFSGLTLCLSPEMVNTFYLAILAWSVFFVLTLHPVTSYRKIGKRNIMMFIKMI